jgi:ATP-dependent RNA helicase SUPV3L1/SUV3
VLGHVGAGARLRLQRRLLAFARDLVANLLGPLRELAASDVGPAARGLLYQLEQSLGSVAAGGTRDQVRALGGADRRLLLDRGIVLGRLALFLPALTGDDALETRRGLCAAELWPEGTLPAPASAERLVVEDDLPGRLYDALGYPLVGGQALRADVLERVGAEIARGAPPRVVARWLELSPAEAADFVAAVRELAGRRRRRSVR